MKTFLWVEKYRPTNVNDCILPDNLKNTFGEDIDEDKITVIDHEE